MTFRTTHPGSHAKRSLVTHYVMGSFAALITTALLSSAAAQTSQSSIAPESFAALSGTAVTLTSSTVLGDVGVDGGGAITTTTSSIVGTIHDGDTVAMAAHTTFLDVYGDFESDDYPCTGALNAAYTDEAITLTPGVYCTPAAVTFTRTVVTLDAQGDENAVWIFKIGTLGTGALTGTGLSVVMANNAQPCNVYWWTAQAATLTTSNAKGSILAGAAVTVTGGSLIGQILAKAGVTMTGADAVGCNSLNVLANPPVIDEDTCKKLLREQKRCKGRKDRKRCAKETDLTF